MKTNLLIGNRNDCGFDGNSSWLAGTILLIRHRGLDRLSKTSRQLASGVMLAAAFAAAQAQGQFYDFEGAVGPEWSHQKVDITPVGNRRFLGQFGNDTVSLTLNGLPAHQEVTVSFDLFIIRTWDGNWGDIWELRMRNGPTLLHTTFSNNETGVDPQAFPKDYPGGANAPQTGAVETNTLGYVWDGDRDAVYHLTFTVPHTDETLGIAFAGSDLEDISNESWGLDNVRVELTPDKGVPYVYTSLGSKGTWSPTNNLPVSGVSIFCTCALVRLGDAGVCLLATTNPAVPVALGSWSTFLPISDAVLVGNLAYIASWEADFLSTVEIVDFTDPAKPVLKGYYDTPGYAKEVALRGNLAYVADAEGGLLILDVGDPAWPRRLGGYDTKGSVQHVEVYGNYAYIRDGNWLITLDVSDPANPRRVGIYEVVGGISALKAVGTKLYVSEGTGDLRILDVSNPASIQLLGTYRGWGGGAQAVALSGRFLYLAKGTAGLHIVDVTDPAKPVYLTGS
ncbi:MAG: hypothetical protein WCQ21_32530, partial [Verrucomicrobiota bacterium]